MRRVSHRQCWSTHRSAAQGFFCLIGLSHTLGPRRATNHRSPFPACPGLRLSSGWSCQRCQRKVLHGHEFWRSVMALVQLPCSQPVFHGHALACLFGNIMEITLDPRRGGNNAGSFTFWSQAVQVGRCHRRPVWQQPGPQSVMSSSLCPWLRAKLATVVKSGFPRVNWVCFLEGSLVGRCSIPFGRPPTMRQTHTGARLCLRGLRRSRGELWPWPGLANSLSASRFLTGLKPKGCSGKNSSGKTRAPPVAKTAFRFPTLWGGKDDVTRPKSCRSPCPIWGLRSLCFQSPRQVTRRRLPWPGPEFCITVGFGHSLVAFSSLELGACIVSKLVAGGELRPTWSMQALEIFQQSWQLAHT